MNFIEELRWRGLIHDMMPGTEAQLLKEPTAGYVGFDPTADSLHVGNLVSILLLKRLQLAGHKPVALVGGATGMVGDPSGKSEERNLLSEEVLHHNLACVRDQLGRFLDYENGPNAAIMVNNYDWFKDMSFLDFLRDVGKYLTVSYMMAKDSVQSRLEKGISFTEFSYQLVQGYDYFYLNKNHNCKLQMGGSDQWGNIVTGTELIRRKSGGEAFALTSPLITKSDGTKFGKTESGTIWLSAERTSPYKFYQFWLNTPDTDAGKYMRIFTFLGKEEIEALEAEHALAPQNFALQKRLAKEVTIMVHGHENYDSAIETTELLFGNGTGDAFMNISPEKLMDAMEGVPLFEVAADKMKEGINIVDLLAVETTIFPSKGECRKMILAGGLRVNKEKAGDPAATLNQESLIGNRLLLVQKGKKNYFLVNFN